MVEAAHLGDLVMTTGVLTAADAAGWEVHVAVRPNAVGLLDGLLPPGRVHPVPRKAQQVAETLHPIRPERVIITRRAHSSLIAARRIGGDAWGYLDAGRGLFLSGGVVFDPLLHRVANHHRLARAAGVEVEHEAPLRLVNGAPPPSGMTEGALVLNPHASWPQKRWRVEVWERLAPALREATGAVPVIIGGPGDEERSARVAAACGGVDLGGKTDIPGLKSALDHARLVVTHDSGPMHMAHALATRVVGVFGATSPDLVGPWPPGSAPTLAPPRAVAPPPPARRRRRWIDSIPWEAACAVATEAWKA